MAKPPVDPRLSHPHLADFFDFNELLTKESPRGAVLISTGYIEQMLADILLAFMTASKTSRELVNGFNAPLGTLSSRIKACFAFGLITQQEFHDLELVRAIRNEFAHDMRVSFETESVRNRCRELAFKAPEYDKPDGTRVTMTPHGQFVTCVAALILNLTNRAHYVGAQRRKTTDWPY